VITVVRCPHCASMCNSRDVYCPKCGHEPAVPRQACKCPACDLARLRVVPLDGRAWLSADRPGRRVLLSFAREVRDLTLTPEQAETWGRLLVELAAQARA